MKKYRPSNGTEGMMFYAAFCDNCANDEFDEGGEPCEIRTKTVFLMPTDPEYPAEWTYDKNERPVCTAFKARK